MKKTKPSEESTVLDKISEMPEPYRAMGEKLHEIIMTSVPSLTPRLWYGMPTYAQDGKVICFFRGAKNERYMTLGFNEDANLDEGNLWPTSYALKELTTIEEEKISNLVKKATNQR